MGNGFFAELKQRGLFTQVSDEQGLADHLQSGSRTLYCGFDPTADSLHIGNLVPLLALRRFQLAGHKPILLLGGATGLIGDPSERADERSLNEPEVVAGWVAKIRSQVARFLDFEDDADQNIGQEPRTNNPTANTSITNTGALIANNLDWTADLSVIDFLRDTGKHFSVNAMVQRESVRSRLDREGQGISFTEFSYTLLQAMDFYELAKRQNCTLQIGGSDQWGNIVSGMDLVRRKLQKESFALTLPLVTKADGTKFGKTASGTVWLDPKKTSPYSFYQFWLNSADADVVNFLKIFTFLDLAEITDLEKAMADAPERRAAQHKLAESVTELVHGDVALESAKRITASLFGASLDGLTEADLEQLQQDGMGCTEVGTADPEQAGLLTLMTQANLAPSKGAARKLVQGKGVRVNGEVEADIERSLDFKDALFGRFFLVRKGKKNWHMFIKAQG